MKAAVLILLAISLGLSGCASTGRSKVDGGYKSIQSETDVVREPSSSKSSKIHILITPGSRTIVTGNEALIEKDTNGVIQFTPIGAKEDK